MYHMKSSLHVSSPKLEVALRGGEYHWPQASLLLVQRGTTSKDDAHIWKAGKQTACVFTLPVNRTALFTSLSFSLSLSKSESESIGKRLLLHLNPIVHLVSKIQAQTQANTTPKRDLAIQQLNIATRHPIIQRRQFKRCLS